MRNIKNNEITLEWRERDKKWKPPAEFVAYKEWPRRKREKKLKKKKTSHLVTLPGSVQRAGNNEYISFKWKEILPSTLFHLKNEII